MLGFNPLAAQEDGSCRQKAAGCTYRSATNFNITANIDDGSCLLAVAGCMRSHATNFDPNATSDDGSCAFEEACSGDVNANGMVEVGDLLEILSHFGQT